MICRLYSAIVHHGEGRESTVVYRFFSPLQKNPDREGKKKKDGVLDQHTNLFSLKGPSFFWGKKKGGKGKKFNSPSFYTDPFRGRGETSEANRKRGGEGGKVKITKNTSSGNDGRKKKEGGKKKANYSWLHSGRDQRGRKEAPLFS